MNRPLAKSIHGVTNITFWVENPTWDTGNPVGNAFCKTVRALPFSLHGALKEHFFDTTRLIAVNGESVVVDGEQGKVDKYMFRYPRKMSLETFKDRVEYEVGAVTVCLTGIALPTEVSIKDARIFKKRGSHIPAVAQTQKKLDLTLNPTIDLETIVEDPVMSRRDRSAKDLERLLHGTDLLESDFGYYPDVALSSGNLRRSVEDGSVTLIDVMPFYANGSRLVGGKPPGLMEHTQTNLRKFEEFVGAYGA